MSVLQDTHVDPDTLLGAHEFRWRIVLGFKSEDGEPLAGCLLLDDDLLDLELTDVGLVVWTGVPEGGDGR